MMLARLESLKFFFNEAERLANAFRVDLTAHVCGLSSMVLLVLRNSRL
jgi:hypothetical protein